MLMTERMIVSGVWTGDQRSAADSYPYLSSSGGCRIDWMRNPSARRQGRRKKKVNGRGVYLRCRLRRRGRLAMEELVGLSIGAGDGGKMKKGRKRGYH